MKIKKILCVDDDDDVLDVFSTLLTKDGFEVKTAKNGIECGCMLGEFEPDLIVLDIQMPEMSGVKAIQYLRAGPYRDIKIIVVTGIIKDDDINFLKEEKIRWLSKPIIGNSLTKLIEEVENEST